MASTRIDLPPLKLTDFDGEEIQFVETENYETNKERAPCRKSHASIVVDTPNDLQYPAVEAVEVCLSTEQAQQAVEWLQRFIEKVAAEE